MHQDGHDHRYHIRRYAQPVEDHAVRIREGFATRPTLTPAPLPAMQADVAPARLTTCRAVEIQAEYMVGGYSLHTSI